MSHYEIIETEEGLVVAEIPKGISSEEAARRGRGAIVDPGPYPTYDEAYDALVSLKLAEEEGLD